jgi:UDP-2-acetamido-2-deoxy-ribo-hexuluronate aminotransferase
MYPIQMVDLKRQYARIKTEIDKAVMDVMESASFIQGQPVREFCRSLAGYLKVAHVIPCANGTDALQISLMALNLKPGDEVITPSFTFIATVEVVGLLRLTPVFVDVDPATYCLDITQVEKAITPRTKAIIPVHLYGQSAEMEPLLQIARERGIVVIEDNAQAIGSEYRFLDGTSARTGTMGSCGCISFFPSKNLGAFGDAGAICTNDDEFANVCKMIADHGQRSRYHYDLIGCNSRMDTLQATILNIKLKYIEEYIAARIRVANAYDAGFMACADLIRPFRTPNSRHVFHQYTIQLENGRRDELHKYLATKEIPSAIYYPVPAHKQKMFASFKASSVHLPVTERISERVLSLPIHTEMEEDQQMYIISSILEFFN